MAEAEEDKAAAMPVPHWETHYWQHEIRWSYMLKAYSIECRAVDSIPLTKLSCYRLLFGASAKGGGRIDQRRERSIFGADGNAGYFRDFIVVVASFHGLRLPSSLLPLRRPRPSDALRAAAAAVAKSNRKDAKFSPLTIFYRREIDLSPSFLPSFLPFSAAANATTDRRSKEASNL